MPHPDVRDTKLIIESPIQVDASAALGNPRQNHKN